MTRIEELEAEVADLKAKLRRCFKGEVIAVRNELILDALKKQTEQVLAMPPEDIKEYLEKKYD